MENVIYSINGPVVTVKDTKDFSLLEMVYVGHLRLIGEVIGITDKYTTIQVYESTSGGFGGSRQNRWCGYSQNFLEDSVSFAETDYHNIGDI